MNFDLENLEPFPPVDTATQDGLLAIGGDLGPGRLVLAYRSGIFPWYTETDPILWWSPDPRCVIFPEEFSPSRSLVKSMRNRAYNVTLDQAFEQVIEACAGPRKSGQGTWLSPAMRKAYIRLAKLGVAHSVEVWQDSDLVGGLYGIALGSVFFGESMFSHRTDASKVAYARLNEKLLVWGFDLVDCQVTSPHILRLGAREITREAFLKRLESGLNASSPENPVQSRWAGGSLCGNTDMMQNDENPRDN